MLGGLTTLLVLGCRSIPDRPGAGVEVVVEGGAAVPEALAGRWQSDRNGWEFVLAPDGRITSVVISLGRVRVVPGRTTTVPTRTGDEAVFTPGPWTVYYAPDTKQLTLRIAMDHVHVQMGADTLEGSSTDIFAGPLDTAAGVWQAEWTTFTRYTAHTPDNPSADLSTDSTYGESTPLAFRKTADR
jgi:hypothetical protein